MRTLDGSSASSMVDWETFYASFRRPDFIPGYEILNHLGGGAFGEVYKAKKRSIGKSYAIKFLRLDEDSQRDIVERELESVRLFAAIDHPNLVTIEDMGVIEGVPYLIMGYAGEDTLARQMKRGELGTERAMRYFVQVSRGVLALHDRRLAHFDLKPSNIFLRGDVARVGDYGLAKLLIDGRQTLSFGRGTPQYMAPEMLKNRADHRADLYSLGVILFECIAGRLPYPSASGVGLPVQVDDVPPDFPADFPEHLCPVVTRLLRVSPDDRYDGVDALLGALGQASRQGDSVRIRFGDLPAETRALQAHAPDATDATGAPGATGSTEAESGSNDATDSHPASDAARADEDSATSDELRRAAAELARGAVGVAKGVWDGVKERVSSTGREEDELYRSAEKRARDIFEGTSKRRPATPVEASTLDFERAAAERAKSVVDFVGSERPNGPLTSGRPAANAAPAAAPIPAGEGGGEVVSLTRLDEGEGPTPEEIEAAALSPPSAPWRRELERVRAARSEAPPLPGLLATQEERSASVATLTVPVPPRAEGGLLGNVLQSVIVGAEIMAALVTGPVLVALRGTASLFDQILSGVPGLVGVALRSVVTFLLLALLGGLVAFAFLAAWQIAP